MAHDLWLNSYGLWLIVMAYGLYYLRTKTEVPGALHVSAIWDLLYQNC